MNLFGFSEVEVIAFVFVLLRISGIMFFFPFFGDNLIPGPVKIMLSLSLSFVMFPLVKAGAMQGVDPLKIYELSWLVAMVAKEMALGLLMGFAANSVFDAIGFAAHVMELQMGFGMANSYDPSFNMNISAVGRFYMAIAMLLFLAMDGHHLLIASIGESFARISLGGEVFRGDLQGVVVKMTSNVLLIGVKLAAPLLMVITLLNVGMGIIARAVPQMNVFAVSLTVNVLVGLVVLLISLPMFAGEAGGLFSMMGKNIALILRGLHG